MFNQALGIISVCVLGACGVAYVSPSVREAAGTETKVRVIELTPETVLAANRAPYTPLTIPSAFYANAGSAGGVRGAGALPEPAYTPENRPSALQTRVPPPATLGPYEIGVGDVVLLATPSAGGSVEQLSGLLAAQNSRQGYTVQDDGAIAIPNVGRVEIAGMNVDEAEAALFQALVQNNIDPTFSLEITEFNSKRVAIGGAVRTPTVVPIGLTPLRLDEAIAATGGFTASDQEYAAIRLYRDGTLYQIPLNAYFGRPELQQIRLVDGDSVFVDTDFELEKAAAYFDQQIRLTQFRQSARAQALAELQTEVNLRRSALEEERSNFERQLGIDAVDRDYVYLTGEVRSPARFALPFNQSASLADALYDEGGFNVETANPAQIYVLRGSSEPSEFGAITAWQLNARNAVNLVLATRMELRPDDIIFLAEQPVTRWNRALRQSIALPTLINAGVASAVN